MLIAIVTVWALTDPLLLPSKWFPMILYYLISITRGPGKNHQDTDQAARKPHQGLIWVPKRAHLPN